MRVRRGGLADESRLEKTLLTVVLFVVLAFPSTADAFPQRATGAISGRVVSEDGQPIPHARVSIVGVGGLTKIMSGRLEVPAD
ncbi:MAG: hypothetical protein ABI882_16560, partial [Acidobacteriota bacterium]